ncbi:hypothetical protein SEA_CRICKO_77 [Streptomyces phage CricKo]|nr:hypothetical protein SEA_RAINYDAI_74 [Streptomyces phage Rainydai]QJD49960.1 hypothetical protein SEA_CRICKO_77 [Streptomyces phage CricKo]QNL30692.1 hypothetical protein SEA_THIQQUMS_77 [Streptomyces phage Thiqqums]
MSTVWDFFIAYWLMIFWAMIGAAFLSIGVLKGIDLIIAEIRFQIERRRYRRARR